MRDMRYTRCVRKAVVSVPILHPVTNLKNDGYSRMLIECWMDVVWNWILTLTNVRMFFVVVVIFVLSSRLWDRRVSQSLWLSGWARCCWTQHLHPFYPTFSFGHTPNHTHLNSTEASSPLSLGECSGEKCLLRIPSQRTYSTCERARLLLTYCYKF